MNVLITGTSSGIGKGCAKYFLKNGHKEYIPPAGVITYDIKFMDLTGKNLQ